MRCAGMKRHRLRSSLRLYRSGDDPRRDPHAVVGKGRDQPRQLDRRDANLLAHRNGGDRNLRPPARRLGDAASFAGQFDSGLLPESEGANVFIEAVFAQAQAQS